MLKTKVYFDSGNIHSLKKYVFFLEQELEFCQDDSFQHQTEDILSSLIQLSPHKPIFTSVHNHLKLQRQRLMSLFTVSLLFCRSAQWSFFVESGVFSRG